MSASLGLALKRIRLARGMTLRDMSACTKIPVSTLSKVEHDRLTLSFHRLSSIADRLGIQVADLFSSTSPALTPCRRSLERLTPVRDPAASLALFTDLTHKRMTPTLIHLRANTTNLVSSNIGEQLLYILHGTIDVHTRYYAPTRLTTGEAMYFDSEILVNFTLASNSTEAQLLSIHTPRSV